MPLTEADLITDIQRVAEELGHPPSSAEIQTHGNHAVTTYYDRFGSWDEALRAAGFDSRDPKPHISDEELLEELRRLTDEIGRTPKTQDMEAHGAYSRTPYRYRFETWAEALEAAGLDTDDSGYRIATDDLLEELKRLADELGQRPTQVEMDRQGAYSTNAYRTRFGSWNEALEAAGVASMDRTIEPSSSGPRIEDDELLAELQRLSEELGRPPTLQETRERGAYAGTTYYRRFGSWVEALEAAGLDTDR